MNKVSYMYAGKKMPQAMFVSEQKLLWTHHKSVQNWHPYKKCKIISDNEWENSPLWGKNRN